MRISNTLAAMVVVFLMPLVACANEDAPDAALATEESHDRLEVDHLLVFVGKDEGRFDLGTQARERLALFPHLTWHEGQGTGGLYAYFENFYIEFLALEVPETAMANADQAGTDFNVRNDWRAREGATPFGIGIRDYASDPATLPFETFDYAAEWMGGHFSLAVAENAGNTGEPWTFTMPISVSGPPGPDLRRDGFEEHLAHPIGVQNMTALDITLTTDAPLSPTMQTLVDEGLLSVSRGEEALATITFDDGVQGEQLDLRPQVPIVIDY